MDSNVKDGLFGIGLDNCRFRFEALLENLKKYQGQIKSKINAFSFGHIAGKLKN